MKRAYFVTAIDDVCSFCDKQINMYVTNGRETRFKVRSHCAR